MKEVFTSDTKQELDDNLNEFIENHDVIDWPFVTIVTEIVKDDTPAGYHWKATLTPKPTADALKDMLVEEYGIVRHFWSKVDIQEWATERYRALTDDELEKVADSLAGTDCEYGISWQTIDGTITSVIDWDFLANDGIDDEEDDNGLENLRHIEKQYTPDEQ